MKVTTEQAETIARLIRDNHDGQSTVNIFTLTTGLTTVTMFTPQKDEPVVSEIVRPSGESINQL